MTLLRQHAKLIEESGIVPEVLAARGYRSVTKRAVLLRLGFGANQSRRPGHARSAGAPRAAGHVIVMESLG
jgi:hypothetical protein